MSVGGFIYLSFLPQLALETWRNESAHGNTQNSTQILGTGHQGMTWFAPGTRVGVLPEAE